MSERDSESSPDASDDRGAAASSAALLESMTLLATLSTAADVRNAIAERRAGRDPAAQEPADVAAASLHATGDELMDLLMQLMLGRVHLEHEDEAEQAMIVRHFDLLMKLRRAERLLHGMHQRLLSLYPDVSEAVVEEARIVHDRFDAIVSNGDVEHVIAELEPALERAVSFVVWTRHEH